MITEHRPTEQPRLPRLFRAIIDAERAERVAREAFVVVDGPPLASGAQRNTWRSLADAYRSLQEDRRRLRRAAMVYCLVVAGPNDGGRVG